MTKKEKLISMIAEGIIADRKTVEEIFNIINEYDCKVFYSQMDRIHAKKEMIKKLEKLSGDSYVLQDAVARSLVSDVYPSSKYYHENFRTLNEEV